MITRLPTQLFVSREAKIPEPGTIKPVGNWSWKPRGGLWTSTLVGKRESGWTQWCNENEYMERLGGVSLWALEPKPADVFELDCFSALAALFDRYTAFSLEEDLVLASTRAEPWAYAKLDWERFAQDYDALHLTEDGLYGYDPSGQTLRMASMFVYGWDCESTLWTRWCFESVRALAESDSERSARARRPETSSGGCQPLRSAQNRSGRGSVGLSR